jgi:hypothetical protein
MNIKEKLQKYAELQRLYDENLQDVKDALRIAEENNASLLSEINTLEKEIKADVSEIGKSIATSVANANYRKGYVRTSWDSKKLDGYAIANPDVLKFRKETVVKPSVSIKLV